MAIKVLIQRKAKRGKEEELNQIAREMRLKAMYAEGFISGEALQSIQDPSIHLVISTWKSIETWKKWLNSPYRKEIKKKIKAIIVGSEKMTPYQYE